MTANKFEGLTTATGTMNVGAGQTMDFDLTMRPAAAANPTPSIAVSWHPWSAYYDNPGTKNEKPSALMMRHLDLLDRLNKLGPNAINFIRWDYGWSTGQPQKTGLSKDHWYNRRALQLNEEFAKRDLTGFPVIHQSPVWSHINGDKEVKRFPDDPNSIAMFAEWFVKTYADYVHRIEFWNEPNLEAFAGKGMATPARYVPLLKVFTDVARTANAEIKIVGPNVSQVDWAWVAGCYALGMGAFVDAVGVHMYQGRQSVPPRSVSTMGIDTTKPGWERARIALGLRKLYEVMTANGDAAKPIWNTEGGWSASATGVAGDSGAYNDTAAEFITEFLAMLADGTDDMGSHPVYGNVTLTCLYQAYDPSTKDAHQEGFAIFDKYGHVKPQALALVSHRQANRVTRALI